MLATTAQMLRDRGCCSRIMLYGFSAGGLAAAAAASVPELQVDALVGLCGVCNIPVLRAALAGPGLASFLKFRFTY